jgi:iron(III) transport system permease protein
MNRLPLPGEAPGTTPVPGFLRRLGCRPLRFTTLLLAAMVLMPLLIVVAGWFQVEAEIWRHLSETVLPELVHNTVVLLLGVGIGVFFLGTSLAWLVTAYEFPGRKAFEWLLMLPLAMPAYVLAFVLISLLDFAGPVQSVLRGLTDDLSWFPQIRSPGGVILVMSLALYPYVYLLARSAFLSQGRNALEAGRVLGLGPVASFFRVALPMARPAVVAGVALALMETLADFGAVSVFNYDTFTTAIYKAWYGLFSLPAAAQIASILLLFVALALFAERSARGKARYETGRSRPAQRKQLSGKRAWMAAGFCWLVLTPAFIAPSLQLLLWVAETVHVELDAKYLSLLENTLLFGAIAAALTLLASLVLVLTLRQRDEPITRAAVRIATLGYALPGSVLAVGSMIAFVAIDRRVSDWILQLTGEQIGLLLSGSAFALIFTYVVRFLAVAHGAVDSAFERVRPSYSEAARGLGARDFEIVRRVILPLLRPGMVTALLLVLVEVMKEMPATLLLRPFGGDTLAVRIYELTSEGEWERAALPSLTLVLAGLLPVLLLVRRTTRDSQ